MPDYLSVSTISLWHLYEEFWVSFDLLRIISLCKQYMIIIAYAMIIYYLYFRGISTMGLPKLFVQFICYIIWISSFIIIDLSVYFRSLIIIAEVTSHGLLWLWWRSYYFGYRWTYYVTCIYILNYLSSYLEISKILTTSL